MMTTQVKIMSSEVLGIEAFWAECDEHDSKWRCHKQPHDRESQAIKCAKRHMNSKH